LKRKKRIALVGGAVSFASLALIVLLGNSLRTVFVVSPATFIYWALYILFAASTFFVARSLGILWGSATRQKVVPMVASMSAWASVVLLFVHAILWGAELEGLWSSVAAVGLVISGITVATAGIIGLARLPRVNNGA
jgi:hypothetical protein